MTLPNDLDVRLIRHARCAARQGIAMIDKDTGTDARVLRALFERRLQGPGTEEEAEVFNRRDYLDFGGPELVALADTSSGGLKLRVTNCN